MSILRQVGINIKNENVALDLSTTRRRTSTNSVEDWDNFQEISYQKQKTANDELLSRAFQPHRDCKHDDCIEYLYDERKTSSFCKRYRFSGPRLSIQRPPMDESSSVSETTYESDDRPIYRTHNGITAHLHDEKLWRAFSKYGTEMIISRGGRRMFPHIVLSFIGLSPDKWYSLTLEIQTADDRRYRYINNEWITMGMADPGPAVQPIPHIDSPNTGAFWTQNKASFSKVRLTNNKDVSNSCPDGNVLLLSMHKYVAVIKLKDKTCPISPPMEFRFDESTFIAVTAYQNQQITNLKIKNNPFAKAFRDTNCITAQMPAAERKENPASKFIDCQSKEETYKRSYIAPSPPPVSRLGPLYRPYPGLQLIPNGYDISYDRMIEENMIREHFARMSYLLAKNDAFRSTWIKNANCMFDLDQYTSHRVLEKTKDKLPDNKDEEKCNFHIPPESW